MPRTYQVNDYPGFYRNDVPSDFAVARSRHELPGNRVVLANFNQLYKIDPDTLSLWARVLQRCSSCVMWLLAFPYHAKENMLKVIEPLHYNRLAVVFTACLRSCVRAMFRCRRCTLSQFFDVRAHDVTHAGGHGRQD
jgi:hypothetical protein